MDTPRTRLFAIVGGTTGVIAPVVLLVLTRRLSTGWTIAAFAIYAVSVIVFGLTLWTITRKLRCPVCQSENARLVYDDRRAESISCPDCGLQRPTGYSLPDW